MVPSRRKQINLLFTDINLLSNNIKLDRVYEDIYCNKNQYILGIYKIRPALTAGK